MSSLWLINSSKPPEEQVRLQQHAKLQILSHYNNEILKMVQVTGAESLDRYKQICELLTVKRDCKALLYLVNRQFSKKSNQKTVSNIFQLLRELDTTGGQ